jgi:hypothetical protein
MVSPNLWSTGEIEDLVIVQPSNKVMCGQQELCSQERNPHRSSPAISTDRETAVFPTKQTRFRRLSVDSCSAGEATAILGSGE